LGNGKNKTFSASEPMEISTQEYSYSCVGTLLFTEIRQKERN
jgi:hypothetical protein